MQCGLPFVCAGLVATEGVLFKSHRRRLLAMADWSGNPFTNLDVRYKEDNAYAFVVKAAAPGVPNDDSMNHTRNKSYPAGPFGPMIAEWRAEAMVRAKASRKANPNGDIWQHAGWLERTYDVIGGSTVPKEKTKATQKESAKAKRNRPDGQETHGSVLWIQYQ